MELEVNLLLGWETYLFSFCPFLLGVSKMEIATYNYYKYVILETGNN